MITTLRGGPGPSSWLQLPVSHELESAKLGRKVGLWARVVDMPIDTRTRVPRDLDIEPMEASFF